MKPYLDLAIGAPKRLEWLRSQARHMGGDWRSRREARFDNWHSYCGGLTAGLNDEKRVWTTFQGEYFRKECFANECEDAPRDVRSNRGWYTDGQDCCETARGIVARLPHGRYITGYCWTMNDERVYFSDVYDSERDAAMAADEKARIFGEQESLYQERSREADTIRERIDDGLQRLRECMRLRHDRCMRYVRDEIPQLIVSIRDDRATLKADYADVE